MSVTIPALIPVVDTPPVFAAPAASDPAGFFTYDVAFGGLGFRLTTDQDNPLIYETAPFARQQVDQSAEPGEQTLTGWWLKSQASFHGGAGQLNLERVDLPPANTHIRFDTSLGVDVWTPGKVTRLPDVRLFGLGFNGTTMVTATSGGVDYAIIGGAGGLYQAAWLSGPDANPTVTAIDLTGSTWGGAANCSVTSLCTDGSNYFGVLQLTAAGFVPTVLTYIITGSVTSTAEPVALYEVPNLTPGSPRTNLCTNPSFETGTAGWVAAGSTPPTIAQSAVQAFVGTQSMRVTSAGTSSPTPAAASYSLTTVVGTTYTASAYVYIPTGSPPSVFIKAVSTTGQVTSLNNQWQRISVTFTATATTSVITLSQPGVAGIIFYADAVLVEVGAVTGTYFDGATAATPTHTYAWTGAANGSTSTDTPQSPPQQMAGIVGWNKARLVGCLGASLYELPTVNVTPHAALPTPRYTHPATGWLWSATADAPTGILASGSAGNRSNVLNFTLDTSGGTPFLSGGSSVAEMPPGERIVSMNAALGSFMVFGTTSGIRVGTFDTYTGALKYGPLSVETSQSVLALAGRGRFMYGSYTNQQADGKTGLVRLDLSIVTDQAGRLGWAPDLRPPSTAPTGLGVVSGVGVLPLSGRIVFVTPEGIHTEGNGAGTDGAAWIRTSRVRFNTTEPKLFKFGRVRGDFASSYIAVTAFAPDGTYPLVTVGNTVFDPDEFKMPDGAREWVQMKFELIGSNVALSSYGVKALPGVRRQRLIQVVCNVADSETDRRGRKYKDVGSSRSRVEALYALDAAGDVVLFEEFALTGSTRRSVVIEKVQFKETGRPTNTSDFGGRLTVTMRTVDA